MNQMNLGKSVFLFDSLMYNMEVVIITTKVGCKRENLCGNTQTLKLNRRYCCCQCRRRYMCDGVLRF